MDEAPQVRAVGHQDDWEFCRTIKIQGAPEQHRWANDTKGYTYRPTRLVLTWNGYADGVTALSVDVLGRRVLNSGKVSLHGDPTRLYTAQGEWENVPWVAKIIADQGPPVITAPCTP